MQDQSPCPDQAPAICVLPFGVCVLQKLSIVALELEPARSRMERESMTVGLSVMPIRYGNESRNLRYPAVSGPAVKRTLNGEIYQRIPFVADVSVVVDVGASVGSAAIFFSLAYPEAEVFCFEPHAESFQLLTDNTQGIERIHCFRFGLFNRECTANLHIGDSTFTTNSIHRAVDKVERTESVELRDAANALQSVGLNDVDILKIDTEGCEVQILESLLPHYRPRVIHLEYHNDNDRREIDKVLSDEYLLFAGRVLRPHLGEATYVRRDAFPSATMRDRSSRGLY